MEVMMAKKNKKNKEMKIPVKEYNEGYSVFFVHNYYDEDTKQHHDAIIGVNEDGHNSVDIDAKQLYAWLKKYYEKNKENAINDSRQYICAASMY